MSPPASARQGAGDRRAVEIRIRGRVQGVGFRPFVWRLATELGLGGDVRNDHDGVCIRGVGRKEAVEAFLARLAAEAPATSRIDVLEVHETDAPLTAGFAIVASAARGAASALAPDMATCDECLAEIADQRERRHGYAFTNCTRCGPRLTIMERAPYDRGNTSMRDFAMCDTCRCEYADPADRRFHAQPIACPRCGPKLRWRIPGGGGADTADPIAATATALAAGAIVTIKGLGGFHLACDAANAETVERLRARKRRFGKPFALMLRDVAAARRYCAVSDMEAALLTSPEAPIVLLAADGPQRLPAALAPGLATLGIMLPYTPLHHLLCAQIAGPLVMTSGNLSDEPQCTDNDEASRRLAAITDGQLDHDRPIVNRVDDSVVRVMAGRPAVLRRARGYAPTSLRLPEGFAGAPPVVAMGGELKATVCFLSRGQAILSQHLGDLENAATFDDYRRTLDLYLQLFDQSPRLCAVDLHPDYLSRKLAEDSADERGWALADVQHHHAHIAACLAENAVPLDAPPVLGIALDGLGFGPGGVIWGGEFLIADYRGYERVASLAPVAMPGGAAAIREPWRNTLAHVLAAMSWPEFEATCAGTKLHTYLAAKPVATLTRMIRSGANAPPATSAGRLFDAVAGALGIAADLQSYEGEAAARLEALASPALYSAIGDHDAYRFDLSPVAGPDGTRRIGSAGMWRMLLDDLAAGAPPAVVSARFHKGFAIALCRMAVGLLAARSPPIPARVALSGGCFQNRLLLEDLKARLVAAGVDVLTHAIVPANDGGLSFGQAVIAAARALDEPKR